MSSPWIGGLGDEEHGTPAHGVYLGVSCWGNDLPEGCRRTMESLGWQMKMRWVCTIGTVLGTVLSAGCTSLSVHCSEPPAGERCERYPRYVYSGTQVSADEIARTTEYMRSPRYGADMFDPLSPLGLCILLVDYPLTLAADTLFLPYDAYMVTFGGKTRYGPTGE